MEFEAPLTASDPAHRARRLEQACSRVDAPEDRGDVVDDSDTVEAN